MMWHNYEVRRTQRGWAIVHIRTGYTVEVYKTKQQADVVCARFNND